MFKLVMIKTDVYRETIVELADIIDKSWLIVAPKMMHEFIKSKGVISEIVTPYELVRLANKPSKIEHIKSVYFVGKVPTTKTQTYIALRRVCYNRHLYLNVNHHLAINDRCLELNNLSNKKVFQFCYLLDGVLSEDHHNSKLMLDCIRDYAEKRIKQIEFFQRIS